MLPVKEINMAVKDTITLQSNKESEVLSPIDAKIVVDAALSYFDEEVITGTYRDQKRYISFKINQRYY